jgi:hypothetical protein
MTSIRTRLPACFTLGALAIALALLAPLRLGAQAVDSALAADIASIKAIDNHAHPLLPSPHDSEYDALPIAAIPPFPLPARLHPDAPVVIAAWRTLYGYPVRRHRPQPGPPRPEAPHRP